MNKLQLYLDLMAAWGDAPIDNEAVIELLEETFNKIYKQGREDEAIESQKDLEITLKQFVSDLKDRTFRAGNERAVKVSVLERLLAEYINN